MSKKLWDKMCPEGVTTTGLIHGKSSGVINLNGLKYNWAYSLWETMLNNTWFPKEVDVTRDPNDYKNLLPSEKRGYDRALAQLIFMDGLQTNNTVDNVNGWITAPEVNMVLVRQAFEEALHSQSYAVLVDSISANTNEIYEMWRRDDQLYNKNKYIMDVYEKYGAIAEDDDEAKIYMIAANQCLEGIYFYSGFAFFYVLARAGKMLGTAQMIRFIQRDEITHLAMYKNIFNSMRREYPDIFSEEILKNVRQMLIDAGELEISWGKYIIDGGIFGLTEKLIEDFVHYLVDQRAIAMKLEPIYGVKENPLLWFDSFSKLNDSRTNFFEGNVANYSKGSVNINDF